MPTPQHDPDDSQPLRGDPKHSHRVYIPAEWAPAGGGSGHPKLSGGVEIDVRTGLEAPRGFNRVDQRYTQPLSTLLANRSARAITEGPATCVLNGALGLYEVRTASGNNYDVSSDLLTCDCPDFWRIDASGYGIIRCKHIYMAMLAVSNPSLLGATGASCSLVAELIGCEERTVQNLCSEGTIAAAKFNNVWVIGHATVPGAVSAYQAKMVTFPNAIGGPIET